MNTIHRVIRRSETKMLNKEVDQYGTYIAIGEYNLPGRVIIDKLRSKIRGYYVVWDCQRIGGEQDKSNSWFLFMQYPPESFFC